MRCAHTAVCGACVVCVCHCVCVRARACACVCVLGLHARACFKLHSLVATLDRPSVYKVTLPLQSWVQDEGQCIQGGVVKSDFIIDRQF